MSGEQCPPADCPTLPCVEELRVDFLGACTALDVNKFLSARVLKASLENVAHISEIFPANSLGAIPWLAQLAALTHLTEVELNWGEVCPCDFLTQLPAGCELIINTTSTLEESLPHPASLAHLVTLNIEHCCCFPYTLIGFNCLDGCPNLRDVRVSFYEMSDWRDVYEPEWSCLPSILCQPTARSYWVSHMLPLTWIHFSLLLAGVLRLGARFQARVQAMS